MFISYALAQRTSHFCGHYLEAVLSQIATGGIFAAFNRDQAVYPIIFIIIDLIHA